MTLAEEISLKVMQHLGFREPNKHTQWENVKRIAQNCISQELDAMARIAGRDAMPSPMVILQYETSASWLAKLVSFGIPSCIVAKYLAWKVIRKYRRFDEFVEMRNRAFDSAEE